MPISEKIIKEINNNKEWTDVYKQMLLQILSTEETNYQFSKEFNKIIADYLKNNKEEGTNYGKNI